MILNIITPLSVAPAIGQRTLLPLLKQNGISNLTINKEEKMGASKLTQLVMDCHLYFSFWVGKSEARGIPLWVTPFK